MDTVGRDTVASLFHGGMEKALDQVTKWHIKPSVSKKESVRPPPQFLFDYVSEKNHTQGKSPPNAIG